MLLCIAPTMLRNNPLKAVETSSEKNDVPNTKSFCLINIVLDFYPIIPSCILAQLLVTNRTLKYTLAPLFLSSFSLEPWDMTILGLNSRSQSLTLPRYDQSNIHNRTSYSIPRSVPHYIDIIYDFHIPQIQTAGSSAGLPLLAFLERPKSINQFVPTCLWYIMH
ncbi:hypothetical protein B0O99DRAFT_639086 [Bisporella sp. PMI_857]|nr:hypothetical protein B0O99DRAFT_639086 [Bisporella sp. PMI_857]